MRLLAFSLALLAACACTQDPRPAATAPPRPRGVVVGVEVVCPDQHYVGTGVALSDYEVLTARHVTACADGSAPLAWWGYVRGAPHPVQLFAEVGARGGDVARLVAARGSFPGVVPLIIGARPRVGDRVCWTHAFPSLGERCGAITAEKTEDAGPLLEVDAPAEPGNSGSPAYDASGRLVGVVVEYRADPDGRVVGGAIVDVTGSLEWVAAAVSP